MDVICLGVLTLDVYASPVSQLPDEGGFAMLENAEVHPAGTAHNTAIDLAKLGFSVSIAGRVGNDFAGDVVEGSLLKHGVDTTLLKKDDLAHTPVCFFIRGETGGMRYLYYGGTNATVSYGDMPLDRLAEGNVLHLGGTYLLPRLDGEPTARLLAVAKKGGLTTTLDPTPALPPNALEVLEPSFPHLDYFLPNLEQAEVISGKDDLREMAGFFLDRGVRVVGIKMSDKGCYVKSEDEEYTVPAFPVEEADPTGAGDAFVAGFIAGILKGWELRKTAEFANAMGALAVQSMGSTTGAGSLEETVRFINDAQDRCAE
jgi:sugar/nucleoside kinase (ribokinase family)